GAGAGAPGAAGAGAGAAGAAGAGAGAAGAAGAGAAGAAGGAVGSAAGTAGGAGAGVGGGLVLLIIIAAIVSIILHIVVVIWLVTAMYLYKLDLDYQSQQQTAIDNLNYPVEVNVSTSIDKTVNPQEDGYINDITTQVTIFVKNSGQNTKLTPNLTAEMDYLCEDENHCPPTRNDTNLFLDSYREALEDWNERSTTGDHEGMTMSFSAENEILNSSQLNSGYQDFWAKQAVNVGFDYIQKSATTGSGSGGAGTSGSVVTGTSHRSYNYSQMAICTDGASSDTYGSATHQSQTAYLNGVIVADRVPYVVIPLDHPRPQDGDLGDMAVVIDNTTGRSVYAIVGDLGPNGKNNEVSLAAAWSLGFSQEEANGTRGPAGDFTTIIFPGTKQTGSSVEELLENISAIGPTLYDGTIVAGGGSTGSSGGTEVMQCRKRESEVFADLSWWDVPGFIIFLTIPNPFYGGKTGYENALWMLDLPECAESTSNSATGGWSNIDPDTWAEMQANSEDMEVKLEYVQSVFAGAAGANGYSGAQVAAAVVACESGWSSDIDNRTTMDSSACSGYGCHGLFQLHAGFHCSAAQQVLDSGGYVDLVNELKGKYGSGATAENNQQMCEEALHNPFVNTDVAWTTYQSGGWKPWECFTNYEKGSSQNYMKFINNY
ncbi:hypothetical protein FWH30_02585, partial [Microgenomates group bacterium]|nr:hypothetical protein [Microgenomates group bacterium]